MLWFITQKATSIRTVAAFARGQYCGRILDIQIYVIDTISIQIGVVTSTRLAELVDDTVGPWVHCFVRS
jgi:hypothetical protein